jgi:hypothetical protein
MVWKRKEEDPRLVLRFANAMAYFLGQDLSKCSLHST